MNDGLLAAGLPSLKPLLTALLLPPAPFLLLIGMGLLLGRSGRRKTAGRALVWLAAVALWFCCCTGGAERMAGPLLDPPTALTSQRITALRSEASKRVAIIILGGGVEDWAPEYGNSNLTPSSFGRLRYGVWLARQTRWPAGFSGGVGWGQSLQRADRADATVARRIAADEFGLPLKWVETQSRDTRENAMNTVALLERDGITHVLLVTDYWHMPRALRNFEQAAKGRIAVEAAPMGLASRQSHPLLRWVPSGDGLTLCRQVVRERIGLWTGA